MTESSWLGKIKQEVNLEFPSEDAVSITEHPVAFKVEIDQLYTQNEHVFPYIVKREIKIEFMEDSIKTEEVLDDNSELFNTDLPLCIEKSIEVNILYCYQCNYGTNDKQNLTDHIFAHRLKCHLCDFTTLDNPVSITRQQIHMHRICNTCNYSCTGMDLLVEDTSAHTAAEVSTNEERHHPLLQVECHDCGYTTKSKSMLTLHVQTCLKGHKNTLKKELDPVKTRSGEKLFKCNFCNYQNKWFSDFKTHILKHYSKLKLASHTIVQSEEKPFKCSLCNYSSKRFDCLKEHLDKHSGEIKFRCNNCAYKTHSKRLLRDHIRVHSEKKNFKCNLCDFSCKFLSNLKMHINKHSFGNNLKCDQCDYKAYSKFHLTRHKQVHSDEKPFKCNVCEFSSKYSGSLKDHMRKHSGELNFCCDKCDYKTYLNFFLMNHKKVHSDKKPFKCNLCEFSTKYSYSLKNHLRKHSGELNFGCDECDYKTYSKYSLSKHKSVHSVDNPFK